MSSIKKGFLKSIPEEEENSLQLLKAGLKPWKYSKQVSNL